MEKVFEIYIRTTPERLWEAITDREIRSKYHFGSPDHLRLDARLALRDGPPEAPTASSARARTSRSTRPAGWCRRMVALWSDDVKSEGTSRVTWEIEPVGDSCRLTVTHDQLREGANDELYGGWPMILSGLKTWLETGELLTTPGLADVHLSIGPAGVSFAVTRRSSPTRRPARRSGCPIRATPSRTASGCHQAGATRPGPWPAARTWTRRGGRGRS